MRLLSLLLILGCALLGSPASLWADDEPVFAKDGNIFIRQDDKVKRLTSTGQDRSPILSPDEKMVAFIRESESKSKWGNGRADEIWLIDPGNSSERLLVKQKTNAPGNLPDGQVPLDILCGDKMSFDSKSKKLYFLSTAYQTSCAVNVINVDGTGEKFVTDGNSLYVIQSGELEGNLIIEKHKYFRWGPAYDLAWLVSPDGKDIEPVGDGEDGVNWDLVENNE